MEVSNLKRLLEDIAVYGNYFLHRKCLLEDIVRDNNCTLVFEIIAPKYDAHIIKYSENDIVLLNIVKYFSVFLNI